MSYKVKMVEEEGIDSKFCTKLQIEVDGKLKSSYWDDGEPEDSTFLRDWSWIREELEEAYQQGLKDGGHRKVVV